MENTTTLEELLEKTENYVKTSTELFKSEAVLKITEVFSNLAVKAAIVAVFGVFLLFVNLGFALYIGKCVGATYVGFFMVAIVYLIITVLVFIFRNSWIKNPVCDFIISKLDKDTAL